MKRPNHFGRGMPVTVIAAPVGANWPEIDENVRVSEFTPVPSFSSRMTVAWTGSRSVLTPVGRRGPPE